MGFVRSFHRIPRDAITCFTACRGIPWEVMGCLTACHGIPWDAVKHPTGMPQGSMVYQGIPWESMRCFTASHGKPYLMGAHVMFHGMPGDIWDPMAFVEACHGISWEAIYIMFHWIMGSHVMFHVISWDPMGNPWNPWDVSRHAVGSHGMFDVIPWLPKGPHGHSYHVPRHATESHGKSWGV